MHLLSQELVIVRMWGLFLADKHCAHTHVMLQDDDIMRFELCFAQGMYHLYILSLSVRRVWFIWVACRFIVTYLLAGKVFLSIYELHSFCLLVAFNFMT